MQTAQRAIRRLALIGWLGLFGGMGWPAPQAMAAAPPERILPDSTIFLLKLNDAQALREAFRGSSYGQLWNDPAMKDFREDLAQKVEDWSKPLQEKIGISQSSTDARAHASLAVCRDYQEGIIKKIYFNTKLVVEHEAHRGFDLG
jgi:hypothetical protein